MGQPPEGLWDLGALRTPKGRLLGAELALLLLLLSLLAAPAPPTLAVAVGQSLWGAAALGARLLRPAPQLPHGACLDLLRACSGVVVSLLVALVAIAGSRQGLAVATFSFGLALALLFAYDAFATFRADVLPLAACDPPEATAT